ncbi:ArsR family transcriptional regulator [Anoxybacillus calidus]|jgi:ArsR family transcriptional regulator, arsenate/arsenite/antimonite-responsive transcriptional repressor|uniref:ArsR family transcriptional regulator n=1 Tax=[Anoxybacillus] calidus TaxID=575178 RepID=A0A7V9YY31_9BACL|nr:metalloregulator ArsR/SmtB family transcription factor [Anoxybacillus calidus]MBA2870569.1 ArsR family transcriptional regulator [Anoxybacillus calidus]
MKQVVVGVEEVATVLKLLGDKTRLTIMALLDNNDCCVCELVEIFQMSQPAISQHLRKLKDVGLVKETRKAQWIFYSMNKEHEMYSLIKDILAHIPDQQEKLKELEKKGTKISCE